MSACQNRWVQFEPSFCSLILLTKPWGQNRNTQGTLYPHPSETLRVHRVHFRSQSRRKWRTALVWPGQIFFGVDSHRCRCDRYGVVGGKGGGRKANGPKGFFVCFIAFTHLFLDRWFSD
ncbi:hypothetical protein CDAR_34591 [Caerostris darwini]|uniref:Uncharacterized protein n=1 Tax=Caerostris darwini TaxID=1538125 RepID=A0AAV4QGT9_9ARAC|nr:hypothetical protein CDAR_34591 [Caerostris darwini]